MKLLLFLCLLLAIISHAAVQKKFVVEDPFAALDDLKAYSLFKHKFNKNYATEEEDNRRFKIFQENRRAAEALDVVDEYAHYGVTIFMDISHNEFVKTHLMTNFTSPKLRGEDYPILPKAPQVDLPVAFDWSSRGVLTGIYNQGQCGSCWAFSTTENVESMWAIAGHGLRNLAMQQLVSCDPYDGGCGGGNPPNAYQYLMQAGGQDSLAAYPYTGANTPCEFNPGAISARIGNWGYITRSDNENEMASWMYSYGPPSICVDAQYWQYYSGGAIGRNCGYQLDHCVQLTGWQTAWGVGVWNVRNSWGTGWGYDGHCFVMRGCNCCGIGDEVTSSVI